ncbi:MAG: M36 family metallopeptidase [Ilumatobacter sp.]
MGTTERHGEGARRATAVGVVATAALLLSVGLPSASGASDPAPIRMVGAESTHADAAAIALAHLSVESTGTEAGDALMVAPELRVLSTAESARGAITNVYVQQTAAGLDVIGADANVAVSADVVVTAVERLAPIEALPTADAAVPSLDAVAATAAASEALDVRPTLPFEIVAQEADAERATIVSTGGVTREPIRARLIWAPDGKRHRLAWEISIDVAATGDWWELHVDAHTGEELSRLNYRIEHSHLARGTLASSGLDAPMRGLRVAGAAAPADGLVADGSSYRVFPPGVESPSHGVRTLLTNPADPVASPFGWHDRNGAPGADTTLTTGNNVDAFTDSNGDNAPDPGSRPDGGPGLDFDHSLDLSSDPAGQVDAAVTQLFVSTNYAHDFLYAYGFDEAAGNFQHHNLGRGGSGGDAVLAEAHGGDGVSNASFATPPDGIAPRMSNFFWPGSPRRDGVFDQGVVLHEYANGLSNRLTGGRTTVRCLSNEEQAGEGWSDYVGLVGTMQPGDVGADRRGIGTYLIGQSPDGRGIRAYPYSTDMTVDPRTYGDVSGSSVPHGVGSIWAATLWQMTWALIDRHGFDPDLVNGDGGNNLAMQLVVDGLKLQPCNPGFVDARDAILLADRNLTGGRNQCVLWSAFAARGLGASADQGSADDVGDETEAFDLPAGCPFDVDIGASAAATPGALEVDVDIRNAGETQRSVVVTVPLPLGARYVSGSANCNADASSASVRFVLGTVGAGQRRSCSFQMNATTAPASTALSDDFSTGTDWTTARRTGGGANPFVDGRWVIRDGAGRNGSSAAFATGDHAAPADAQRSDLILAPSAAFTVPSGATLRFWHRYGYEAGFDGGVVEISTDGGNTWTDTGDLMTANGYDERVSGGDLSAIAGRDAFTGDGGSFRETVVDLCSYSGRSITFRFRSTTDPSVASDGWWIDSVRVVAEPSLALTATVATAEGSSTSTTTCLELLTGVGASSGGPAELDATADAGRPARRVRG